MRFNHTTTKITFITKKDIETNNNNTKTTPADFIETDLITPKNDKEIHLKDNKHFIQLDSRNKCVVAVASIVTRLMDRPGAFLLSKLSPQRVHRLVHCALSVNDMKV